MTDTERRLLAASTWAGVGAPTVTLVGVFVATLVSPDFWWTTNALSGLGSLASDSQTATSTTRILFNGGLITGGMIGLAFGPALYAAHRNGVELAGVVVAGLALVSMGLIGIFPLPTALHVPVAVSFFGLMSVTFWVYGAGNYLAGATTRGVVTASFGVLNTGAWTVWALTGPFFRPGLALPEAVGAAAFGFWALWTARDVRDRLEL